MKDFRILEELGITAYYNPYQLLAKYRTILPRADLVTAIEDGAIDAYIHFQNHALEQIAGNAYYNGLHNIMMAYKHRSHEHSQGCLFEENIFQPYAMWNQKYIKPVSSHRETHPHFYLHCYRYLKPLIRAAFRGYVGESLRERKQRIRCRTILFWRICKMKTWKEIASRLNCMTSRYIESLYAKSIDRLRQYIQTDDGLQVIMANFKAEDGIPFEDVCYGFGRN